MSFLANDGLESLLTAICNEFFLDYPNGLDEGLYPSKPELPIPMSFGQRLKKGASIEDALTVYRTTKDLQGKLTFW